MGRQAVQNAVLKVGEGVSNTLECFDFITPYTWIKDISTVVTRINVTRKIILTGEAQHGAGDKPNQVAESVVARLRPRRSESQFSIPGQSGEISHRNCPDRPWELPNLLHIAKGKFFRGWQIGKDV